MCLRRRNSDSYSVVVGGGPTGVKFSGKVSDFIIKDVRQRYAHVKNYIHVTLIEGVYVTGDCAEFLKSAGKPVLPGLAQVAERKGKCLASLLNRIGKGQDGRANATEDVDLDDPFVWRHVGQTATLGRYKALVYLRQCK